MHLVLALGIFCFQGLAQSFTLSEDEYIRLLPKTLPKWPQKFYITGILSLPYAELNEPFAVWYNGSSKQSRIDYYGGK